MLEEFTGSIAHIMIEGIGRVNQGSSGDDITQDDGYSGKNASLQCQIALENVKLAGFSSISISCSDAFMNIVDAVVSKIKTFGAMVF
jgi:hypothetical protein